LVNTWKVIFATLVIFGAGVITGGLLVAHSEHLRPRRPQHSATPGRATQPSLAGGMKFEFLRRVEHDLNLTAEQRARVDQILSQSQERTRGLMREEVQKTKDQFREVLTPEQRTRFDELLKQQRARDQRHAPPGRERPAEAPAASNAPAPAGQ
jgi:Spy/CpxP family protein refolding chaperone